MRPLLLYRFVLVFLILNSCAKLSAELFVYEGFDGGVETGRGVDGIWSYSAGTDLSNGTAYVSEGLSILGLKTSGGAIKGSQFGNTLMFNEMVSLSDSAKYVSFIFNAVGIAAGHTDNYEAQAGVVDQDDRPIVSGVGWAKGDGVSFNLSSHIKNDIYAGAYDLAAILPRQSVFTIMKFTNVGSQKALIEVWFFGYNTELPPSLDKEDLPGACVYGAYYADGVVALKGLRLNVYGMDSMFDEFRVGDSYGSVVGRE